MNTTFIYGLKDPNTLQIRYVGKSNNPESRLKKHIKDAENAKKVHRLCWIKGLLERQQRPLLEIIEEVDVNIWGEREDFWIKSFPNLTNMIDGGKFCPMLVPEIAKRAGQSNRGKKLSATTRKKLSARLQKEWDSGVRSRIGKKKTDEEKVYRKEMMKSIWALRNHAERTEIGRLITEGKGKKVVGCDKSGLILHMFKSAKLAANYFGVKDDSIAKLCRKGGGYNRKSKCVWKWGLEASDELVVNTKLN